MTTYEYKCNECDVIIDYECTMGSAPATIECPQCDSESKRFFGSMNFVLKGEGWPGKNIKNSKSPTTASKRDKGLALTKKIEDVQNARVKAGLPAEGKNAGKLSEAEVKRRKNNLEKWIDQGK